MMKTETRRQGKERVAQGRRGEIKNPTSFLPSSPHFLALPPLREWQRQSAKMKAGNVLPVTNVYFYPFVPEDFAQKPSGLLN